MKRKALLYLAPSMVLLFGMVGALWAFCPEDYNRPGPLMDFVSQSQGIYDTMYDSFTEADCRLCHGDLTGDLHRFTGPGLNGECNSPLCHAAGPPAPGTQLSCVDPMCHGDPNNNKVHHTSDLAASGQCTACHRPDLVARLRGAAPLLYYPSEPAPSPFTCENCHWDSAQLSPNVDAMFDLHHMSFIGPIPSNCFDCHALAYNDPNWDPYNPTLIRFCENCHTKERLHAVHSQASNGWEAVGFHVPGHPGENTCDDYEPVTYRLFTADEKCVACHGEMPSSAPAVGPQPPAINHLDPYSGGDTSILIMGANFGSKGPDALLIFTPRSGNTANPIIIPSTNWKVTYWTDSVIVVITPYYSAPGGNYDIQVRTAARLSNRVLFTLTATGSAPPVPGAPVITNISPTVGTEDTLLTLEGSNFGDRHCCDREVHFRPTGQTVDPVAMPVHSWSDTKVVVRFRPWTLETGVYDVAVHNESGYSNQVNFTKREAPGPANLTRDGLNLTITGGAFGDLQSEVFGDNYGYASQVKIGDRNHTYTATDIVSWADDQIDLVLDSFVDENGSPVTELFGEYGLLVETAYFYDTNPNGQLDPGDQVHDTVTSSLSQLSLPLAKCELVPDSTFIPKGGTVGFQATVTNNSDKTGVVYFATKLILPNGNSYPASGYLYGPTPVSLTPYGSKSGHISHILPGSEPLGTYTYRGYVGRPGPVIYHECQFEFEVVEP